MRAHGRGSLGLGARAWGWGPRAARRVSGRGFGGLVWGLCWCSQRSLSECRRRLPYRFGGLHACCRVRLLLVVWAVRGPAIFFGGPFGFVSEGWVPRDRDCLPFVASPWVAAGVGVAPCVGYQTSSGGR